VTALSRGTLIAGLLVFGSLLLVPAHVLAQCAMCRSVLASPEGQQLAAALRSGILFLLAAPFVSFAIVAFLAVRRQRRRESIDRSLTDERRMSWTS